MLEKLRGLDRGYILELNVPSRPWDGVCADESRHTLPVINEGGSLQLPHGGFLPRPTGVVQKLI